MLAGDAFLEHTDLLIGLDEKVACVLHRHCSCGGYLALLFKPLQREQQLWRLCCLRTQIGLFGFPSAPARTERLGWRSPFRARSMTFVAIACRTSSSLLPIRRAMQTASNARPITRTVSPSNCSPLRKGLIGMLTYRREIIPRHAGGTFDTRLFESRKSPGRDRGLESRKRGVDAQE